MAKKAAKKTGNSRKTKKSTGRKKPSRKANGQNGAKFSEPIFQRILLKISGEMLGGKKGVGLDPVSVDKICNEIKTLSIAGVETAVVVGGGNIVRGREYTSGKHPIHRATADYMGMTATLINALALQDTLEHMGVETRVMSAIRADSVCEPYIRRRALAHLKRGRVVIFAGGTGNPYCSTDTAAALRAFEIKADILLKATKVDGVYTADPEKVKNAKRYDNLSHMRVLRNQLNVMDAAAISLCMENKMKIMVYSLFPKGNSLRAACGAKIGTLVK